ncbi:MAG: galactokinase [Planctomycetales bacterium]|nr:galactokinase [Planctomycetales bacterium]
MSDASHLSTTCDDSLQGLCRQVKDQFRKQFRRESTLVVAAPGRVNLIGEHVDYNDGFVLPMAIERYVVIAASPRSEPGCTTSRLHSLLVNETVAFDWQPGEPIVKSSVPWANYLLGALAGFVQRGHSVSAFDAVIGSSVPLGGGLSSSAALEVATATLAEQLTGVTLSQAEKALLCQTAEHDFAGVPCGIMDQFSSVFGEADHLMLLDCRSQEVKQVPLASPDIEVLIANSNVRHELSGGEYAERRRQCDEGLRITGRPSWRDVGMQDLLAIEDDLGPVRFRRARHVVSEIERTCKAAESVSSGDWSRVGACMYASHDSLRDDFEVSCEELDVLVSLAHELGESAGVIGSRMTGGGFGGCTVSLVRTAAVVEVARVLGERYHRKTGIYPQIFATRPARGAHVVEVST